MKINFAIYPLVIMGMFLIFTSCDNKGTNSKKLVKKGTVTDIDGNVYQTVTIGTQVWMAENLKTTKYRDGSSIPNVIDNTIWYNLSTGAYCNVNNDASNTPTFGLLYNWHAVNDPRNIAPTGWHVPTDVEWHTLALYLDASSIIPVSPHTTESTVAGGSMKETGTMHWPTTTTSVTNETGFTALPNGFRRESGTFYTDLDCGAWWSSTENDTSSAWSRFMNNSSEAVSRERSTKLAGISIRCLKD